jgi:hypothetical protein
MVKWKPGFVPKIDVFLLLVLLPGLYIARHIHAKLSFRKRKKNTSHV